MSEARAHHKGPPRAAAWGLLTMEHFFARPCPASEDEEEDDEPPTKYRCVEATTASNSTAVAMDCTNVKSTRRRTKAEVAAAPFRRFRSAQKWRSSTTRGNMGCGA